MYTFLGETVRVSLYSQKKEGIFDGMKVIRATLSDISEDGSSITLELDGKSEAVLLEQVANVKTVYDF